MLGRSELVHERGLIGEQKQATRVLVEASDAGDLGIAPPPVLGKEAVDIRTFALLVLADEAERFVHEQEQSVRVIEWFAIDFHVLRTGFLARIVGGQAANRYASGVDPVTRLAA